MTYGQRQNTLQALTVLQAQESLINLTICVVEEMHCAIHYTLRQLSREGGYLEHSCLDDCFQEPDQHPKWLISDVLS